VHEENLAVSVFKTHAACHRNTDDIAMERVAGSMDVVLLANERDLALCVLTGEARMYSQVCAAFERLAASTIGSCLHSVEPISDQRLQALPRAAPCLRCQEAADHTPRTENARPTWPLPVAV
jgi:RNA polymerase-binding transcription factor DksA